MELYERGVPWLVSHTGWFALVIVGLIVGFMPMAIGGIVDKIWPLPRLTEQQYNIDHRLTADVFQRETDLVHDDDAPFRL
jgi:hypothetical protein